MYWNNKHRLRRLRFSRSPLFLEQHPELLKAPIIISDEHSLSGYNKQKINMFLTLLCNNDLLIVYII